MTERNSGLYVGAVTHTRLRPRRHSLRYRLYSLLIDLDELPTLSRELRLFSHNAFNLFSLHDKDYGDGSGAPLRAQVEGHLRAAGLPSDGPIRLFALPRVLGYAFNPISIFFCHRRDGDLAAILYEVHNTFGERHCYLIPVEPRPDGSISQGCDKDFHVSPFMDIRMKYQFRVSPPAERVRVGIVGADADGPMIVATQIGDRAPLTDAGLARVFITHPLVTLKVISAIHWEALKLWIKGIGVRTKPPAPATFVTTIPPRAGA
jgi:DUF1365 family protein